MKVDVKPGKYILAVSGGVDSMVLLDLLAGKPGLELIVAHFNHNIRNDSIEDEKLVERTVAGRGLILEVGGENLGKNASEEAARTARYAFLNSIKDKYSAKKIITAHHQDDMIETALINIIRGTNRAGLSSIINDEILRPLLGVPKAEIRQYATDNKVQWNEDQTNHDTTHLRNYLRLKSLKRLNTVQRAELVKNLEKVAKINSQINQELATLSQTIGTEAIDRQLFSALPNDIGNELLAYSLKRTEAADFDSKTVIRLNQAIRTSRARSIQPVKQKVTLELAAKTARFVTP